MSPTDVDGYLLFSYAQEQVLAGIREVGTGRSVAEGDLSRLLELSGLTEPIEGDDSKLSEAGLDLYRAAFVVRDAQATKRLLGQALRSLLPIQVIAQELGNSAAIPEDGVISLLALHRVVDADFSVDDARSTFRWLNDLGVVVYSRQKKTVRFVPDDPGAAKAGEVAKLSAMISPRTPFSNVARLRRVLRGQTGTVTWADQHFGARAFEELVDELDPSKVAELRIISGSAQNVLSAKSYRDYLRFQEEMTTKGIKVEWRVDPTREWHDRWLVDADNAFNVPPVNSLFANQYSEILPSDERPPVEEWWARSAPRTPPP
ncbi:hypothetical protein ACFWGP_12065 [Agromyces sp. NPDC127015]|uniref:hypothetical protein n=1 Tax=Agromyces sp. NPDC127015 TaxID=3347108 RepID=UPI003656057F